MKLEFILVIIVSIFIFSCVNEQEKEFILKTDNPKDVMFEITNNGNYTAEFSMLVNDLDLSNDYKITQFIKNMPEAYSGEPLELKAFRFVRDYTWHDDQLTNMNWANSPALMLNSLGGGLCGLRSAILTNLLLELDFDARSWCVEGHVITEVFSNGKWKVLDPDMGVYYLNDKDEIASYEELCNNPEWFDKSDKYVVTSKEGGDILKAFIFRNAEFYSSLDNNRQYYTSFNVESDNISNKIIIPPGSSFSWPYENYSSNTLYTLAKLSIVPDWCGTLSLPFVLAEAIGEGEIIIGEEILKCKIEGTSSNLLQEERYKNEINVISNPDGIDLYFFINPLVYAVEHENSIKFIGNGISNLNVDLIYRNNSWIFYQASNSDLLMDYLYRDLVIYCNKNGLKMLESREDINQYICENYSYLQTQDSVGIALIKDELLEEIVDCTIDVGMSPADITNFIDFMHGAITNYMKDVCDFKKGL